MYYEIKVKQQVENGEIAVKEYMVEHIELFAEAEKSGLTLAGAEDVIMIKRSRVMEIVNDADPGKNESMYRATIEATTVSDNMKPKKIRYEVMVWAMDAKEAQQRMEDYMKQGLDDMELVAIKKTKIQDIL